jgi:hypothetical protein
MDLTPSLLSAAFSAANRASCVLPAGWYAIRRWRREAPSVRAERLGHVLGLDRVGGPELHRHQALLAVGCHVAVVEQQRAGQVLPGVGEVGLGVECLQRGTHTQTFGGELVVIVYVLGVDEVELGARTVHAGHQELHRAHLRGTRHVVAPRQLVEGLQCLGLRDAVLRVEGQRRLRGDRRGRRAPGGGRGPLAARHQARRIEGHQRRRAEARRRRWVLGQRRERSRPRKQRDEDRPRRGSDSCRHPRVIGCGPEGLCVYVRMSPFGALFRGRSRRLPP